MSSRYKQHFPCKWVAYEISEGQFIFAIVLHPILLSRGEENAGLIQRRYLIRFGKKEEILEVTTLDLYKLIDHHADHEDVTNATELEAARHGTDLCVARHAELHVARHAELRVARQFRSVGSSSTSTTRNKLTDKQKLDELRKKICQDLREVWTVSEKDRKKALNASFYITILVKLNQKRSVFMRRHSSFSRDKFRG